MGRMENHQGFGDFSDDNLNVFWVSPMETGSWGNKSNFQFDDLDFAYRKQGLGQSHKTIHEWKWSNHSGWECWNAQCMKQSGYRSQGSNRWTIARAFVEHENDYIDKMMRCRDTFLILSSWLSGYWLPIFACEYYLRDSPLRPCECESTSLWTQQREVVAQVLPMQVLHASRVLAWRRAHRMVSCIASFQ